MQIPLPKGRTVTAKFYKNVALIKIEEVLQNLPPQNRTWASQTLSWKCTRSQGTPCDPVFGVRNCHHHTISTIFTRLGPLWLFSVSKTLISIWKEIQFNKCPWICGSPVSDGCPHLREWNCFQKWIDRVKRCIQVHGENFKGQSKSNLQYRRNTESDIIFGTAHIYRMSIRNKCTHIFSSVILIRAHDIIQNGCHWTNGQKSTSQPNNQLPWSSVERFRTSLSSCFICVLHWF